MAATGVEIDIDLHPTVKPEARDRGLLLAASPGIPDSAFSSDDARRRWGNGITWLPWGVGNISTDPADCVTEYDQVARELPAPLIQPAFMLYDALTCSTLGPSIQLLAGRVMTNLDVFASAAFAAELETAAASGGVGLVGNATYTPAVASASAVNLSVGLADLEDHLADVLHGTKGVIHLTAGLLTIAVADGLVEWRDGQYRTATGHVVVGDAGHDGTAAPHGQSAATSGTKWIYATGPVHHLIESEPRGIVSDVDGDTQVYVLHNDNRPLAQRLGVLAFDPATIGAALVTVTASDAGAGGGGGGGGDATAANQTTGNASLASIDTKQTDVQAGQVLATLTRTAVAAGAIASAETVHGFHLYNSHATDAVLIYIRYGDDAADTPFWPVAVAAGESVNVFTGQRVADGEPVSGGVGVYVSDESAGSAAITDLVGHIVTGAA